MRAALLHHHRAIDAAGGNRNQEACEIGKLAVFAGTCARRGNDCLLLSTSVKSGMKRTA
jgi:hypothetical protein